MTDAEVETLETIARAEGCSVADLVRRALIRTFHLPTNGTVRSQMEERADAPAVTAPSTAPAPASATQGLQAAQGDAE